MEPASRRAAVKPDRRAALSPSRDGLSNEMGESRTELVRVRAVLKGPAKSSADARGRWQYISARLLRNELIVSRETYKYCKL